MTVPGSSTRSIPRSTSWSLTVGEVLVRAHSARRQEEGRPFAHRDDLDPAQVPHLAAIGVRWADLAARDIYPEGLRTFVDGLLARATPRASG
ncbi:hypothetical protein OHB27_25990 [Streptomyces virginiae]|nr:hypothetical protein [Streptomyces virginiae]